ncbi:MAG TPA: competence/damage-inducible protein A [Vicinamibacteria bacterium]|jgi:nicotinamide-nucleotide amidase|nr:competence/damage-inducible protein A [Vicinamibacteria bacterium]
MTLRAEILAVGSELLTPLRSDTNALYLTERLRELGVEVGSRVTVADDAALLESAFRAALARADIVIATGGLGPTEDDLTREAAAAALGRGLHRDPRLLEMLKERFRRYLREMAPVNEKQADVIEGAIVLPNPRGTAPGQRVESGARVLILLPGPPTEMEPMFEEQVSPLIRDRAGGTVLRTRVLKIASMSESDVEQAVAPVYKSFTNPRTTILGGPGQVELHLTASGASEAEAQARIEALAAGLRESLPGRIYGEDGRELPEVVADLLRERGLTLALAESCTGGLLSARLTDVPGASRFLERAYVTYSNRAKAELLGVEAALLDSVGAVSAEVAAAMAAGVRRAAGTAIGVGITGIAGPDGGSAEKPVGLVFLALDGAAGTRVRKVHFPGGRERVRYQASQAALEMMRRGLLGLAHW